MPSAQVVWIPLFVLLMLITSLGIGFWLSVLNVEYRDLRYIVPFITQFWLFVTPVVYPSSLVPEQWRLLYGLNPMVGVIDGFRWALLGTGGGPSMMLGVSTLVAIVLFVSGIVWFRARERTMVDASVPVVARLNRSPFLILCRVSVALKITVGSCPPPPMKPFFLRARQTV